jgi:hypothetical protein
MNNILNLIFSDSKIKRQEIDINEKVILYFFENAYDVLKRENIGSIILKIHNWSDLKIYKYISNNNFLTFKKNILNNLDIETFEMIMEIKTETNKVTLSGFSKESGFWLNYEISDAFYEIRNSNG